MRDEIVALDLETTGLNQYEDDIIEIGAARFRDGELLDSFGTLINPGRSVPERVTAITGIHTEDVVDAPYDPRVRCPNCGGLSAQPDHRPPDRF